MLSSKIQMILMGVVATAVIALISVFGAGTLQGQMTTAKLQTIVQTAVLQNVDDTARTKSGDFTLNQTTFEESVTTEIKKVNSAAVVTFDYDIKAKGGEIITVSTTVNGVNRQTKYQLQTN